MLNIRPAVPEDVPLILQMIRELAEYERLLPSLVVTAEDLLRDGWGPDPKFQCVIAEWSGDAAGYALFFHNYSTFRGRPGLYLEDVFVRPEFRHRGIGRALLAHVAGVALREGCARLEWQVLDWNAPAIEFYKCLGAQELSDWCTMRVQGAALNALADGAPPPCSGE
jgi:GNAT superfamily N-acetyltransferase